MIKKYFYFVLTILMVSAYLDGQKGLLDEFNMLPYWYDGMTWEQFNEIKVSLQQECFIKYLDKIEQQKIAQAIGLEVPKTYIASRERVPIVNMLATMPTYVVKLTHLSWSDGLIIVKNGINMVTGEPITPEQVQEHLFNFLERKAREHDTWAMYQIEPGFMVQEYIPNRMEVKIQTIFGKAVIGEWRGGESQTPTTEIWGRYDRNGNMVQDDSKIVPEWWSSAIAAAELMAQGTDALRVDFLVKEGGVLLLNELEIHPMSNWSSMETALAEAINEGYRNLKLNEA